MGQREDLEERKITVAYEKEEKKDLATVISVLSSNPLSSLPVNSNKLSRPSLRFYG